MKPKSPVQRNADYRKNMRDSGYVLLQVWCKPEDREKVRRYAEKLRGKAG